MVQATGSPTSRRGPVKVLTLAVLSLGALAVLGVAAFWPRGDAPDLGVQPTTYVDGTVTSVDLDTCQDPEISAPGPCQVVGARLTSGPDAGEDITFEVRATQFEVPELATGDDVVLLDVATSPARYRYSFVDFQRSTPLLWLVAAFVVVVIAFGRWQGVRALVGLAASGLVLVAFLVPSLLRDQPAVPVALAATVVIAFVALYLAHGVNLGTTVALAGTLMALALTTVLAFVVATATNLTGLSDDSAQTLRVTADALDLRGLLIAGVIVGALGVLDDVTVSQVSIVATLRRTNPGLSRRFLYREATRVGRDHVAATVNTLVLAYAGASLPLLLFFVQGDQPIGRLLTSEVIAVEVIRMLVGSIGLVASVPITTALAAAVLGPGDDGRVHIHDTGWHDVDGPLLPVGAGGENGGRNGRNGRTGRRRRNGRKADDDGRALHAAPSRRGRRRRAAGDDGGDHVLLP
jgi:uncharacterized membrane protein